MSIIPLRYTIKVYGEGLTEWFYFDKLKQLNRFQFTLEPQIPQASRSSYKQNLKLIDKELNKRNQERADAIFLVIDIDTFRNNSKLYNEYLQIKRKYELKGVTFIESYPCIELWILYHLLNKYGRTNCKTYDQLRPRILDVLPGYEKTKDYYRRNKQFNEAIIQSKANRSKAISYAVKSCNYTPVDKQDICNYTELYRPIQLLRLLQKFSEFRSILMEHYQGKLQFVHHIADLATMTISFLQQHSQNNYNEFCTWKYSGATLTCTFPNGQSYVVDDNIPLSKEMPIINTSIQVIGVL